MSQTKAQLVSGLSINASAPATALQIDASGNINLDSNTLYVDATNNRVGLGTSSPLSINLVDGTTAIGPILDIKGTGTSNNTSGALALTRKDAGNGSVIYSSGDDGGLVLRNTDSNGFAFINGTSTAVRITSAGRVGIGTTSPSEILHILKNDTTGPTITLQNSAQSVYINNWGSTGNGGNRVNRFEVNATATGYSAALCAASAIEFHIGGANNEKGRFDSSGRFLVGTSSARGLYGGGITPAFQIEGTSYSGNSASIIGNGAIDNNNPRPIFVLGRTRGSIGSNTAVVSGDMLGEISFQGADGTQLIQAASIRADVDTTPGTNDMPGRLVFSTTLDGASGPTERMRIDNVGRIQINTTSSASGTEGRLAIEEDATVRNNLTVNNTASGTGSTGFIAFYRNRTYTGGIGNTGTTTAYNTSSDYRLKENIVPLTGAADRLKQIPVHRFNFITDPDRTVDGFIAHEAQAVVPECVTGEKDAVDDDGNPIYQGIDQSKLVPLLTAALQETIAELQALKAEVAALKGA